MKNKTNPGRKPEKEKKKTINFKNITQIYTWYQFQQNSDYHRKSMIPIPKFNDTHPQIQDTQRQIHDTQLQIHDTQPQIQP